MNTDLKLFVGDRYSVVTMVFFVGYCVVDLPSTIIMKKIGASIMIPTTCLIYGGITIAEGFLTNYPQLAACRVLLGLFEGLFLPGSIFLLQVWYTRFEFHKRMAVYYLVGIASSGLRACLRMESRRWTVTKVSPVGDGSSSLKELSAVELQ